MSISHIEIRTGIWHITDGHNNYCTLISGSQKAILFDTMMGFGDLKGYIAQLTDFEPMVINSHCHYDHIGGNYQFDRVWMCELDFPLMAEWQKQIPALEQYFQADLSSTCNLTLDMARVCAIAPFTLLDLGGRTVQVIALPGHTAGCIGLLCQEEKLLLAGDAISPQMCLYFPDSLPLETYVDTLHFLRSLDFDSFLLAHFYQEFPKSTLKKFEDCASIVGKHNGIPYTSSIFPDKAGTVYILDTYDSEISDTIGIIVK